RRRDVDVVRAGQVAGLQRAQEAEAVRQDLEHAVGLHALAVAGEHLQDREDHVLLAGAGHALLDVQLLGDLQQLGRGHLLEVAQRVLREALGHLRVRLADEGVLAEVVAGQPVAVAVAATAAATTATTAAAAIAVAPVAEALAPVVAAATVAVLAAAVTGVVAAFVAALVAGGRRGVLGGRGCGGRLAGGGVLLGGTCLAHALLGRGTGVGIGV